ncbi:hypothetical protein AB0M19_11895 [Streptomyces sp. NPDC051920]|uniref:hypothetical protein n=1 Tax=Streptomyces sp. NPDC051920 TaxID=3155523 RepID=UPI00343259AA
MSTIVDFFAAPDDASAARVLHTGPRHGFEPLSFGNFDPEEAAVEWECLLAGGSFEDLVEAGGPRLVAGHDDDGSVVFALSPRLFAALAEAGRSELEGAAISWVALRAEDGEDIGRDIASVILDELAALVRSARHQGHGVYCRVA